MGDFEVIFKLLANNYTVVFVLIITSVSIFYARVFRNYFLLKQNEFLDASFRKFLLQGTIAGTVSVYGPLKSGELLAIKIYDDYFSTEKSDALSMVVVSRIFDVVIVILLASSAIFFIPRSLLGDLFFVLGFIISVLICIIFALLYKPIGLSILAWLLRHTPKSMKEKVGKLNHFFVRYYDTYPLILKNKQTRILFVLTSLFRWCVDLFASWFLLYSFEIRLNFLMILPIVGFSYAIGVASGTPGALGTAQLTSLSILLLYGIDETLAATALIFGTAINTLVILALGLGAILINFVFSSSTTEPI